MDEKSIPIEQCDIGPELVSVALTNSCDLDCHFCYAPKSKHRLSPDDVVDWSKQFSSIGSLEVAFGGGEPTIYRDLSEVCRRIWTETDMGISITTHGHHLTDKLLRALRGHVSVLRISIDAPEPHYSAIRGKQLDRLITIIEQATSYVAIGVNTVVSSTTLPLLDDLGEIVERSGAVDWLLLPEIQNERFNLTDSEWTVLNGWINRNQEHFALRVTAEAISHLSVPAPLLDTPNSYVHIGADGLLRRCSYHKRGVSLKNRKIDQALSALQAYEPFSFL